MANNQKNSLSGQNSDTSIKPFALGIKSFAIVGIFIFIVQLFRGSGQSESPDKVIYVFAAIIAGVFLLLGTVNFSKINGKYFYSLIAFFTGALGIFGIEQHAPINGVVLSDRLWLGFGPYVLLLSLLLMPFALRILEWQSLKIKWKFVVSIFIFVNTILVLPSLWQSADSVIDADHSEYVINELFAPIVGHWPYADFIPQYQSFYGFLFKPFAGSMSAEQLSNVFLICLTLSSYLTIALGVFIAWNAINRRSVILAIGLVVPFTGVTQFPIREGYLGSIGALLSGLSIRLLPGIALLGALIVLLHRSNSQLGNVKVWKFLLFGFATGIVSWQSQDFGIAAAVTAFLVILFAGSTKILEINKTLFTLIGFIPGFALYPAIATMFGNSLNFNFFLFFARQFGSGFGSERIRTPGPVLVILPLIVMLIVIHGIYLYKQKKKLGNYEKFSLSSLIGFTFALWSLFGFTYYLNRSYASGQMQILFLPISISISALIGIILQNPIRETIFGDISSKFLYSKMNMTRSNFVWSLPLLLIISLPISSLLLTPNPAIEMKRIVEGADSPRWPKSSIEDSVVDAIAAGKYAKENDLSIGFFGASANYIEYESGVKSVSILNSPYDLLMSQQTINVSCQAIYNLNPDVLVVSDEGASLFKFEGNSLCNVYIQQDIPGVRNGRFAVKLKK
jgi:hypothetical protein